MLTDDLNAVIILTNPRCDLHEKARQSVALDPVLRPETFGTDPCQSSAHCIPL